MNQLKRLDVTPEDPYTRACKSRLRHVALSQQAFAELQSNQPDHVILQEDAVLIAQPYQGRIGLQYGFSDAGAFARQFPAMFAQLIPAFSLDEAPLGVWLRLTEAPSRPYVDPVLVHHAFEVARDWVRMRLPDIPAEPGPADDVADGFMLRQGRGSDTNAIAELDAVAFPMSWLTPDVVRDSIDHGPVFRVLEDVSTRRVVGFLRLRAEGPRVGYISDIALHPDYHRRGLGEAMMRWALARFHDDGRSSAALTVSTDNRPAIALYRKLGFTAGHTGIDYRRPIDEDEVRQIMERNRGPHITVRRRF